MTLTDGKDTLRSRLTYEPQELRFGTSGRRGEVVHLTQLEVYINALAELEYLQSLPAAEGGVRPGGDIYLAYDLRPSSTRFDERQAGRGELAQVVERAIRDAGMRPINLGAIPTPALTFFALGRGAGSIMITGSHIPFDWNGYKTNTARDELKKEDEGPITEKTRQVRQRVYQERYADSPFDGNGMFKTGHSDLAPETTAAHSAYVTRYADFFGSCALQGKRILVYQHSAVGRDILVEILERLGAAAIPCGRSDEFIPIDTENIDGSLLDAFQAMAADARSRYGALYAVVSTDGDSDRPIILGPEPVSGRVSFFSGDLVGIVVAEYLRADAVVVPVSCNDAIDLGKLGGRVAPRTRIGSPYVTAGMERARRAGARLVCGWEANGGFILGSDVERNGMVLNSLPTRDAVLPILGTLLAAREENLDVADLFARLPKRFSRATLLRRFPRTLGRKMVDRYSPSERKITEILFRPERTAILDENGRELADPDTEEAEGIRKQLEAFFTPAMGFGEITRVNFVDGVRISFGGGDVVHFRPSGNADELRLYALADTPERADEIVRLGIDEPDGILRKLEKSVSK